MVRTFFRRSSSSSCTSINGDDEETSAFRRLVTKSKWPQLRALLLTGEGRRVVRQATALKSSSDRSILHDLLANDPPVDIVEKMIAVLDAEHFTNRDASNFNCTPLHVAVANCASFPVIKSVLMAHQNAAAIADDRGVTPLMIECSMGNACHYDTVKLLVQAVPGHVVMAEDADGQTALEYALISDAIDIFQRLQRLYARQLQKQSLQQQEERRLQAKRRQQQSVELSAVTEELHKSFSMLDGLAGLEANESRRVSRSSAAA
mmetsp:Transcript_25912/g.56864  ORF Transcript_25912/g.56864 Transcript_25912/m.56864 type:complete len:262 (+) Transcript_25912:194-979(+)